MLVSVRGRVAVRNGTATLSFCASAKRRCGVSPRSSMMYSEPASLLVISRALLRIVSSRKRGFDSADSRMPIAFSSERSRSSRARSAAASRSAKAAATACSSIAAGAASGSTACQVDGHGPASAAGTRPSTRIVSPTGTGERGVASSTASSAGAAPIGRTSYASANAVATAVTAGSASCKTSLRILPRIQGMTDFADFAALGRRLERVRGRLEKRDEVARFLKGLAPEEIAAAVAFLGARVFPASDPRVLGVRWLPRNAGGGGEGPPLTLREVAEAFADVAAATGAGVRRVRDERLTRLAEIADDFAAVLTAHGGRTALEYKYDGARIQLHRAGDRVQVWTRRLSDVTRSLPDVVAIARHDLSGEPYILDGEVVALDAAGRPLPFQELMRRFRRVHGVEALAREMPLALHFFDCLMADGRSLIDEPYERRWQALTAVTRGRYLAERCIVTSEAEATAFRDRALAAGHEGVMAKDLGSTYEPGGRGKRWFKLKTPETIDCVIVAVDRGSGRRVGWLSNYHLAVRDGETFADVGKTFKGFTDAQFVEMTARLSTLATADDGYTVRVRPEVVVEVEYNEIQRSPTYRSGLALRFARIARVRDDKSPGQATTLEELRHLYERQFQTKGRAGDARRAGD